MRTPNNIIRILMINKTLFRFDKLKVLDISAGLVSSSTLKFSLLARNDYLYARRKKYFTKIRLDILGLLGKI
ncbi:hypothetical protein SBF1_1230016 [Candidatus Desulfosporosinus infrequens]|uniref:Uncharacterized protein n=1 Tax=Candidatus Desulfosporosinus infrequens TaxID=2043169 RepID=A0A2U3K219_9FIRM|nr:hypothetical protein SBF1_1230016 [Candidatus Desulfosporosinus infrequens]